MASMSFIKNIAPAEPQVLTGLIDYQEGRVVSRTFAQTATLSLTLFAFDRDEGLSAHTASGDAFVHVIDGEAEVSVGEQQMHVKAGEVVAMPAGIPHALHAAQRFKMLLVVIKGEA